MGSRGKKKKNRNTGNTVKKKNSKWIIILSGIVIVALVSVLLINVFSKDDNSDNGHEDARLKFSELYTEDGNKKMVSDRVRQLNGTEVLIKGFMAEQSPVDKSFIYLVNAPFTVCPFCIPGDNTKLEVISIYDKEGKPINFLNEPVEVYGELEVRPKKDEFGYLTQFRIFASEIKVLESTLNEKFVTYFNQLSREGLLRVFQTVNVNVDYSLFSKIVLDEKLSDKEKYKHIKEKTNPGFLKEGVYYIDDMQTQAKKIDPVDTDIKEFHTKLLEMYTDMSVLLNKTVKVFDENFKKEPDAITDAEIAKAIKEYRDMINTNREIYNEFDTWNKAFVAE
jgi:hypothetical protein